MNKNKFDTGIIIILVIIALTLFFLNLNGITLNYNQITGRVTDTAWGSANVTISSITQINVSTTGTTNNTNISFGTGYVLSGWDYCTMSSQSLTLFESGGCSAGLNSPGVNFTLQNVGNTNLTVNISCNKDAAAFLGGTNPTFNYAVDNGTESGCKGMISGPTNWFAFNSTTPTIICTNLSHVTSEDTMQVAVNISIPANSKTGSLEAIITFTGLSA